MKPEKDYEYVGLDKNDIKRVYGYGPTADVAETECHLAAVEYIKRRPDTGPLLTWAFEKAK